MRINLKRNWFGPGGARLRTRDNPHTIPDAWGKFVPGDAEVLADEEVKAPPKTKAEHDKKVSL